MLGFILESVFLIFWVIISFISYEEKYNSTKNGFSIFKFIYHFILVGISFVFTGIIIFSPVIIGWLIYFLIK